MSSVVQLVNYLNYVVCSIDVVVVVVVVGRCDPSNLPHFHPSVMRPFTLQSSLLLLLFLSAVGAAFNSKFAAAVTVF